MQQHDQRTLALRYVMYTDTIRDDVAMLPCFGCCHTYHLASSQGGDKPRPPSVILSAAKDLSPGRAQILHCAQDDRMTAVLQ